MKKVPLKRKTPLKRKKGLNRKPYERKIPIKKAKKKPAKKKAKKRAKLRSVSPSRVKKERLYRKLRNEYLRKNPCCEFPACEHTRHTHIIDLHHKIGRVGSRLYDERYFSSLCTTHHMWIHKYPKEGEKLGFIIRLTNEEEFIRKNTCRKLDD